MEKDRFLKVYTENQMDFNQTKLTKTEWEFMEKKVDAKELAILKMIRDGILNPSADCRLYLTANQMLKLDHMDKDYHIFMVVFKELFKKNGLETIDIPKPKKPLTTADSIRLKSMVKKLDESIEMVLLDLVVRFKKSKKSKTSKKYFFQY